MECSPIPAKVIATCFALAAFMAALVVGWSVGNSTATILYRALLAMLGCWVVGYVVGVMAQKVVDHHIEEYKKKHPIVLENQMGKQKEAGVDVLEDEQGQETSGRASGISG